MFDDEAKMRQMVSFDPDIAPIPRWMMTALQFPDAADFLAKKYGTKADRKFFKELLKEESRGSE